MPTADTAQYVARIRSLTLGRDPIEILSSTPDELRKLVTGIDAQRLHLRPAEHKWSAAEIMAHLADSEMMAGVRFRQILSGPNGMAIPAYNQNAWATICMYEKIPYTQSLVTFSWIRRCNLRLLERLNPTQMEQYGVHDERGRESVGDILTLLAGHDINHLQQISSAVAHASV